jgi:hypothetical protein
MRQRSLRVALFVAIALAAAVAGCGPATGEELSDPRDILARTIRATAQLRTVDLRLEFRTRDGGLALPAGPGNGGTLEAQIDLVATELSGRVTDAAGAEQGRFILVDGSLFTSTPAGRWTQNVIPGGDVPNPALFFLARGGGLPGGGGPDYFAILSQAVAEPGLDVRLAANEDCRPGRCYRTLITIPPAQVWPLGIQLLGLDAMPGFQPEAPDLADVPAIALSVLTDARTLRLEDLALSVSMDGSTVDLLLSLRNHDAGLQIAPPPADLVDPGFDFGGVGGGDGGFGPPIAPMPAPAEPVPVPVEPAPSPVAPDATPVPAD